MNQNSSTSVISSLTTKKPRGVRTNITLVNKTIPVYAGRRVAEALTELTDKDGAREVFDQLDSLKRAIPHRNPGHPRTQKK